MFNRFQSWQHMVPMAVFVVCAAGCKDRAPVPRHPAVVAGGPNFYAMPYDRSQTAEWVDFRDPEEAAPAPMATPDIESEVRAFIEEYNEVVETDDLDELLLYHVEAQRELLKPYMVAAQEVITKFDEIEALMIEKLPAKKDEVESTFASLKKNSRQGIVLASLEVVNDKEAIGSLPPMSPFRTYRFVGDGEEWSLEVPDTAPLAMLLPQVEAGKVAMDQMLQGLKSGAIPAEVVLQQISTVGAALNMMSGGQAEDEG